MLLKRVQPRDFEQRVAIVYPFPYLDSIPSLCNAARLLSQHGFGVDIFTRTSPHLEKPSFEERRIQVFSHQDKERLAQSLVQSLTKEGPNSHKTTRRLIRRLVETIKRFIPAACLRFLLSPMIVVDSVRDSVIIWRRHRQCPYRCFIGIDAHGLVHARQLLMFIKVPLAYWSLELLLSHELQSHTELALKHKEIALSKKAPFIVIQDKGRARLLAGNNGVPFQKFVLVPNAPLGPVHHQRLDYWHRRFGLPRHKKVVIHAGNIDAWTGIADIVASVTSWPEDWVLVVHTRSDAKQSREIEELRHRADSERIFFSVHPVPRAEYDDLIDSADIGIAFYVLMPGSASTQENIRSIGLSSGKVAYYLRSGLPIIINHTTSLRDLIKDGGCGVIVTGGQGIGQALEEIAHHYEEYRANAYRCFEAKMDFTASFEQVIESIERL